MSAPSRHLATTRHMFNVGAAVIVALALMQTFGGQLSDDFVGSVMYALLGLSAAGGLQGVASASRHVGRDYAQARYQPTAGADDAP